MKTERLPALALASLTLILAACGGAKRPDAAAPSARPGPAAEGSGAPQRAAAVPEPARVSYVQGRPLLLRGGAAADAVEGQELFRGDVLETDGVSSVEIAFGSFASVRVMPGSRLSLATLEGALAPESSASRVRLDLAAGAVLAKARKLGFGEDLAVVTDNAAAGVRGTEFLVRYEPATAAAAARTVVAVRAGRVAALPKGAVLETLLDGRYADPVSGAAVAVAFAFAPAAGPGQEIAIGGAAPAAAEAAYASLRDAAASRAAEGLDWASVTDPSSELASPESRTAQELRSALGGIVPRPAADPAVLELLDRLRDPGADSPRLPAALPLERPSPSAVRPSAPRSYPGLSWNAKLSSAPVSEPITRAGSVLIALDGAGLLHAVAEDGKPAWSAAGPYLSATAVGDAVFASTSAGVEVLDARTGSSSGRADLGSPAAPGASKPVPVSEGVAVATPRGIAILRSENAVLLREVVVPGGLAAPPVLAERELVALAAGGDILVVDPEAGAVLARVPSDLSAPAFAPRYKEGRVYAADRKGAVVAFDVPTRTLAWSRSAGTALAAEPELGADRVYLWTRDKSLLAFNAADGADAAPPARGVSSPPLSSGGFLYWGTDAGELVVADVSTGRIVKRIAIPDASSVRPLMMGGDLFVGTGGGRVLKLDGAALR